LRGRPLTDDSFDFAFAEEIRRRRFAGNRVSRGQIARIATHLSRQESNGPNLRFSEGWITDSCIGMILLCGVCPRFGWSTEQSSPAELAAFWPGYGQEQKVFYSKILWHSTRWPCGPALQRLRQLTQLGRGTFLFVITVTKNCA
jgi:hypothetical protein